MIELSTVPQVALDCLNKDHAEVADIINQLDSLLQASQTDTNAISAQMNKLIEHLENHFACEQHQMEKYQFPPLPIHRGEHQRVLNEINQVNEHWLAENNTQTLLNYFQATFCPWLIEHISTLDTQTALYIVNAGGR